MPKVTQSGSLTSQTEATTVIEIQLPDSEPSTPSGPCQKCNEREATVWWIGHGGTLAFVHGMGAPWCKICALEEQIAEIEKLHATLPQLRAELYAARIEENEE